MLIQFNKPLKRGINKKNNLIYINLKITYLYFFDLKFSLKLKSHLLIFQNKNCSYKKKKICRSLITLYLVISQLSAILFLEPYIISNA